MSCFLCAPGMRGALWDAHPVNMGKSLPFSLSRVAEPQSQEPFLGHGGFIILSLFFPFDVQDWVFLGSKTQPEEVNVRGAVSDVC